MLVRFGQVPPAHHVIHVKNFGWVWMSGDVEELVVECYSHRTRGIFLLFGLSLFAEFILGHDWHAALKWPGFPHLLQALL